MIHYHGAPLSGPHDQAGRFFRGRHALVSYAYPGTLPIIAESVQSFVLDNGAFTEWKRDKGERPFDYGGYVAWVSEWARHPAFDWCIIPDVIGGTVDQNADLVTRWTTSHDTYRVPSVPVWHFHEPVQWLASLAGRFERVALGSSGQWPNPGTDSWWERLNDAMCAVCDAKRRPRCKLHGLRMLHPDIFRHVPLHSADSTNACVNAGSTARFETYPPLEAWQRAAVIADRIEAFNSAPVWEFEQSHLLFA
jgi:hypothetical protein